jgi:hypothetical protein
MDYEFSEKRISEKTNGKKRKNILTKRAEIKER